MFFCIEICANTYHNEKQVNNFSKEFDSVFSLFRIFCLYQELPYTVQNFKIICLSFLGSQNSMPYKVTNFYKYGISML
jgi:hypothetical protein